MFVCVLGFIFNVKAEDVIYSIERLKKSKNVDYSGALDNIETNLGEDNGLVSGIFQDWNTLSTNIVSAKIQLEELLKPNEESSKTPKDIDAHIAAVKKSAKYKYLSENLKK